MSNFLTLKTYPSKNNIASAPFIPDSMSRFYTIMLSCCCSIALSQNPRFAPRHDNVWLFGYSSYTGSEILGGSRMTFDSQFVSVYRDGRPMDFYGTNSSICDPAGNLLLYTNGYYIANVLHDTMDGGGRINPDYTAKQDRNLQGALILPAPEMDSVYYLIHDQSTWAPDMYSFHKIYSCLFSTVDMKSNNGLGKVGLVNELLVEDTLCFGKLTACKHANGRDWWILIPKFNSALYFKYLLGPSGIKSAGQQILGDPPLSSVGQSVFSPDGTKYIKLNTLGSPGTWLDIYDFDRCTGTLSNYRKIFKKPGGAPGAAISPNSRYLYISQGIWLYQYDLEAADIEYSEILLGEYDGYLSPLETYFFQLQLAPDGKLYMNSASSVNTLHIIHQPDLAGIACRFEQHGLHMPTLNSWSMPNFPNYRLGPLDGSPCDTLGLDNLPAAHFRWEFWDTLTPLHVTFMDLSIYEPANWQWTFGDGGSSTEKDPEHEYATPGTYPVCLKVSNANGEDSTCYVLTVGISSENEVERASLEVAVVPNPFQSILAFSVPEVDAWQRVDVLLHDMTGRVVAQTAWRGAHSDWELGLLPGGVYFYDLITDDGRRAVGKVVKW